jgi:hypothetical protein
VGGGGGRWEYLGARDALATRWIVGARGGWRRRKQKGDGRFAASDQTLLLDSMLLD